MPPWTPSSTASPTWNGGWPAATEADAALIRGIAAYRRHPYQRTLEEPGAVWREGASRVLDYGPADGVPMLVVPSLVNRAYVLDLAEGASMLRWLSARGVRPLLLDWGWPETTERLFTLTDYVAGRLARALDTVHALCGPPLLTGYCMGGNLALAAALRQPGRLRGLALLATPWDFPDGSRLAAALPTMEPLLAMTGTLPIDALQALFAAVEPGAIARKFRAFGARPQDGPAADRFVGLEDWLNDGVPLAAPVAREVLAGWYGGNTPGRGIWCVADEAVRPERLPLPCLVAVPGQDRIVPPDSALALARLIPGATVVRPASGHVGMVAGSRAEAELWEPLLSWVRSVPG